MMKKIVSLLAIAALTAIGSMAVQAGQYPRTGVNGSMHDITYLGAGPDAGTYNQDDFQRVCIFCHTPHNAQPQGDPPAPLWNHQLGVDLNAYVWAAPANNNILIDVDPLIGPSRLCMGCHDGITAVDKHGPSVGTAQGTGAYQALPGHAMTNAGRAITDLTVTHPIGFQYSDAETYRNAGGATELVPAATGLFIERITSLATNDTRNRAGTGFTYQTKKISDVLYGGYVTCASCHEVHNPNNALNDPSVNTPGFRPNYFVWAREQGSALCLSCHIK